mgnify:FL=1
MIQRAVLIQALSPLHAGTGQAVNSVVDLPIARYRSTGIPFLPGSSIKGVLRDVLEERVPDTRESPLNLICFGPKPDLQESEEQQEEKEKKRFAGAVVFNDARLLLLPVRSLRGTFAYVTSPLLLRLAQADLAVTLPIPKLRRIPQGQDGQPAEARAVVLPGSALLHREYVYLEDIDCKVAQEAEAALIESVKKWGTWLAEQLFKEGERDLFSERFVVVDDETMTFLWETATQVDARIRINDKTHVVQEGALWYEESLPAESILVGLLAADRPRKPGHQPITADMLLDHVIGEGRKDLQFGGKATVGRGRAQVLPVRVAAIHAPEVQP